ncbi:MAG: tRNA (cytidine(34)-2'-O)-methyltransferase [Betaproteobacteria bacterium]|nr:tRNA (cytidine(34)-2'-O)-methyltransferase [Betaproteobacteria bacterium]
MFDILLYQPEIPPNTGNIIRLAANTGCRLHLIEPLGFSLDDKQLKRAGLDYHEYAELKTHADWPAASAFFAGRNIYAFSKRAQRLHTEATFEADDVLLFGPETRGLPNEILAEIAPDRQIRLPMRPGQRSLNLSNAAAVAVFEAWRQLGFAGGL